MQAVTHGIAKGLQGLTFVSLHEAQHDFNEYGHGSFCLLADVRLRFTCRALRNARCLLMRVEK